MAVNDVKSVDSTGSSALPRVTGAVVVGAGPAGLAVSACLNRAGVEHVLVERESSVASAWRRHYDRLHLHTSRGFSALPYVPMPRDFPRYPSRTQVVRYLESYARDLAAAPALGVEVTGLRREGTAWAVDSTAGAIHCDAVIVATGTNGEPVVPSWEGLETFPGSVVHSTHYTNAEGYTDQDVLVVGFGNSGGEIALDLVEHGSRPVVSVRSPVNIVPRDVLGIPVLALAIPLAKLPPRVADTLIWPILKAYYPSYRRLGLRKATRGPFQQMAEAQKIPLLDIGTVRAIRRGRISVEGEVLSVSDRTVTFAGGRQRVFDAMVLATGYRPSLPNGAGGPEKRDPAVFSEDCPGLYHCGFYVAPTGMFREIAIEAELIAGRIASARGGRVARS